MDARDYSFPVGYEFPFPVGSPAEEITFLLEFVNGDWQPFHSDGLTAAFYYTHTANGRPITGDALDTVRAEARTYLRTIARKRRPRIAGVVQYETDARDRRRRVVPNDGDFPARVREAARHLLASERRVRECRLCEERFFFPSAPLDRYCRVCRQGHLVEALRLEQARERKRRARARQRDLVLREHARLLAKTSRTAAERRRLEELDARILALEPTRHPLPPPPGATYKYAIYIGGPPCDVQIRRDDGVVTCGFGEPWDGPHPLCEAAPKPEPVCQGTGTYDDILESYRAARLKGHRFYA